MKTFEEKKQEALARGIKPGARIRCANDGAPGAVAPIEEWREGFDELVVGKDRYGAYLYATCDDSWATVLTPAPQAAPEGLVDGMTCEPDEHMRAAIVAKAMELGLAKQADGYQKAFIGYDSKYPVLQNLQKDPKEYGYRKVSTGEFYDRLCRMPKVEPPIRIGGHEVKFEGGDIMVGDAFVSFDTLEKVYQKAKGMR